MSDASHAKSKTKKRKRAAIQASDASHAKLDAIHLLNSYHATKSKIRDDAKDLIMRIEAIPLTEDLVFDTYPQVVAKLKEFLARRHGVTQ